MNHSKSEGSSSELGWAIPTSNHLVVPICPVTVKMEGKPPLAVCTEVGIVGNERWKEGRLRPIDYLTVFYSLKLEGISSAHPRLWAHCHPHTVQPLVHYSNMLAHIPTFVLELLVCP